MRAPEVHEIVWTPPLDGYQQEALVRELEKRGIEIVEAPAMEVPAPAGGAAAACACPAGRDRPDALRLFLQGEPPPGCSPRRRR